MTILPSVSLEPLRATLRGRVWLPSDPDFEFARRPWNLAVAQDAVAVVEAADDQDVIRLVRFAGARGIPVAVQPTGHGATGRADGAVVLRTGRLDTIEIDPGAMTARIGAGVRSGALQRAAAEWGLTALPGSSPGVSVAGAVLGGGLSWFGRAYGWIADSVLAFDVVQADGEARHVTPASDPDLFWALRGGGGDLAIVTALELQLRSAPQVFGGRQLWAGSHGRQVADVYRTLTATAPDALSVWLQLLSFPGADPMIAIDSTFLGEEDEARRLLRETSLLPTPLTDTRRAMSVAELGSITGEPIDPSPGRSRAELLTRMDANATSTLVDEPIAPLMAVQIRHLGGAFARATDNPHGALTEPYAAYMFGVPSTPELGNAIGVRQAAFADALPTSGRKPISFLSPDEELSDALPAGSIDRLRKLKGERDPGAIIRGNFGIRP